MNAMTAIVEPENVTFNMPALGDSSIRELTDFEIDFVWGGDGVANILGGIIAIGGGTAAIGSGLGATGVAATLIIGGGGLVVVGGIGLIAYGIIELV